jgi:hypothetical protein
MLSKNSKLKLLAVIGALSVTPAAFADHNSIWGEGWASMPNDIHNTRIDTLDEDTAVFQEFVSQGAGADSVNRFLDDASDGVVSGTGAGSANAMGGSNDTLIDVSATGGSALRAGRSPR